MDARRENRPRAGLVAAALLALVPLARAADTVEGLPLAVHDGRCDCILATPRPGEKFFLIVGSLNRTSAVHRVVVRTRGTAEPVRLRLPEPAEDAAWSEQVRQRRDRLERARQQPPPGDYAPAAEPLRERSFFIFTGDQDFHNPDSYTTVKAELRAVGRHCCVYLDRSHPDPRQMQPTVDDIVRTFDEEVWPKARARFGRVLDVDRDGRFTILLSGVLERLQNGKTSLGGFVRGSDFHRDLRAPFGNRCDMMFLNTDLKPGPHLRTLLAHEFTHAIVFSEHVFGDYLPEVPHLDEESWLNEGLAHLAEDLHGYGWSNLDHRISAFLSAPGRYPLVVADYYRAGVWRTPGIRGACYLFLRWCADNADLDFTAGLTRTNLTGIANLETTTGVQFADLFRRWSLGLLLSGSGLAEKDGGSPLRRLDLRQKLGDRVLCGPYFEELPLQDGEKVLELSGTSVGYLLLHSPASPRCWVEVSGPPGADLQVTLVRLPAAMGRLSLRWQADGDAVRLAAKAHDAAVTLTHAGWERLTSTGARDPAATALPGDWFPQTALTPGQEILSRSLLVETSQPVVFKVSGVDAAGHPLTGWEVLSAPLGSCEPAPGGAMLSPAPASGRRAAATARCRPGVEAAGPVR
jgi:hypothetical protein